jgi:glutathione synthase/RimK-type ligase-like ATP-grasp enzyme
MKGLVVSNYYGGTARAIAQALGWKVTLKDLDRKRRPGNYLNYGTTGFIRSRGLPPGERGDALYWQKYNILNPPHQVANAVDKLQTLKLLTARQVPCLTFTVDPAIARTWLAEGRSIVCRSIINGHSGQGIDIIKYEDWRRAGRPEAQFPAGVKLFTKYFPKREEVRVHVFKGNVLGYARKMARRGVEADPWVRSHGNGWVFGVDGVERDDRACDAAIRAVSSLGLDFAAVDIGLGRDGVAVFEVNSAPGMEGRTLESYVVAFKQHFGIR